MDNSVEKNGLTLDDYVTVCINGYPAIDIFYNRILHPIAVIFKNNREGIQYIFTEILNKILLNISMDFETFINGSIRDVSTDDYLIQNVVLAIPGEEYSDKMRVFTEEVVRLALHIWFSLYEFGLIDASNLYKVDSYEKSYIAILIIKDSTRRH